MGYKEKIKIELHKGMFSVKELVKRLDDPVHLNSRTVNTYVKRLLKEGKIIDVLDRRDKGKEVLKYVTVDLYCYKYIASRVRMWKNDPEKQRFLLNFARNILQLMGDFSLDCFKNPGLIDTIEKVPFDKKHSLYI